MIGATPLQGNLFFLPLAEQICSDGHPVLDQIEEVCNDSELLEMVRERLASRRRNSARTGRPGMAPDQLLRVGVLKHLAELSFRQLAFELRSNLVYRVFTHYYEEKTPDFSTLCRNIKLLS
jgi:transposase